MAQVKYCRYGKDNDKGWRSEDSSHNFNSVTTTKDILEEEWTSMVHDLDVVLPSYLGGRMVIEGDNPDVLSKQGRNMGKVWQKDINTPTSVTIGLGD
ncbi:hypothetical protein RND71_002115 [Anisodus tanguticus]|uniref:Uncharacterized protein n=1 Tax=Anisodus tanguticus TaxID=243964 RepID=A0AAE1T2G9_9SOLA|nr:hypothetical protein RND71_002115 [Anisodus tanguticus]